MARSDGAYSTAEGNACISTGNPSHAEGLYTTASGLASHAEGGQSSVAPCNTASGIASHVEGGGFGASGGNTASNTNAHAEGNATTANNINAHAEGSATTASGAESHAEGNSTTASGATSHSGGWFSEATRMAQLSRSSGSIAGQGVDAQFGQVYMMLRTADANPHILLIRAAGGTKFNLETNKSYRYRIMVIARDNTAAGNSAAWQIDGGAKNVAGVTSNISGAPPIPVVTAVDGGAIAWTCVAAVNAGTDTLDITVQDPGAATINWMASLDWVETLLAPV